MIPPILGRRLVLENAARLPDGAGGFAESWQALGILWAEVRAGKGRAASGEEAVLSRVPYRITVRAAVPGSVARPLAGQRFREGDRLFRILSVTERDTGGRYLVCETDEETAA
jgi:head-tail adaptor